MSSPNCLKIFRFLIAAKFEVLSNVMIFKLPCCSYDISEFIGSPHNMQNVKHY